MCILQAKPRKFEDILWAAKFKPETDTEHVSAVSH